MPENETSLFEFFQKNAAALIYSKLDSFLQDTPFSVDEHGNEWEQKEVNDSILEEAKRIFAKGNLTTPKNVRLICGSILTDLDDEGTDLIVGGYLLVVKMMQDDAEVIYYIDFENDQDPGFTKMTTPTGQDEPEYSDVTGQEVRMLAEFARLLPAA